MNLFDIEASVLLFQQRISDLCPDGEWDEAAQAESDRFFAELGPERDKKLESYCYLIREAEGRSMILQDEASRCYQLAARELAFAKRLKARLQDFMEATGETRIKTPKHDLSVRGNGGKAPLKITVPANELPPMYQRLTVEADTDIIRKLLESGVQIDGCTLEPRGKHLEIR